MRRLPRARASRLKLNAKQRNAAEYGRTLVGAVIGPRAAGGLRRHGPRSRLAARREVHQRHAARQARQRQRCAALRHAPQPKVSHSAVRGAAQRHAQAAQAERREAQAAAVSLRGEQPRRGRRHRSAAGNQRVTKQVAAAEVRRAEGAVQRIRARSSRRLRRSMRRGACSADKACSALAQNLRLQQPHAAQRCVALGLRGTRICLRSLGSALRCVHSSAVKHHEHARRGKQLAAVLHPQRRLARGARGLFALCGAAPLPPLHAAQAEGVAALQRERHALARALQSLGADVARRRLHRRPRPPAQHRGRRLRRCQRRGHGHGGARRRGVVARLAVQDLYHLARRAGQQLEPLVVAVVGGQRRSRGGIDDWRCLGGRSGRGRRSGLRFGCSSGGRGRRCCGLRCGCAGARGSGQRRRRGRSGVGSGGGRRGCLRCRCFARAGSLSCRCSGLAGRDLWRCGGCGSLRNCAVRALRVRTQRQPRLRAPWQAADGGAAPAACSARHRVPHLHLQPLHRRRALAPPRWAAAARTAPPQREARRRRCQPRRRQRRPARAPWLPPRHPPRLNSSGRRRGGECFRTAREISIPRDRSATRASCTAAAPRAGSLGSAPGVLAARAMSATLRVAAVPASCRRRAARTVCSAEPSRRVAWPCVAPHAAPPGSWLRRPPCGAKASH